MNPSIRVLLVAFLLLPSGVRGSSDASSRGDADVATAKKVSSDTIGRLQGIGNLTVDRLPQIYGERPVGDPGAASDLPRGTRASANPSGPADAPEAQLPRGFQHDAAPPPQAGPSPASAPSPGMFGRIANFFSPPAPPPAQPLANPSFAQTCPSGDKGCVSVLTFTENSPGGVTKDVPLTDFVDYGTVKFNGASATSLWDSKPWWKFWQDSRQVSSDDIHQGDLGDCYLLAALAAISVKEPYVLRDMIKQQKGTLAVWIRFFEAPAKSVMVGPLDDKFPAYTNAKGSPAPPGTAAFAAPAGKDGALWPLYIEKAYTMKFTDNSFAKMTEGGVSGEAMSRITGQPGKEFFLEKEPLTIEQLAQWDQNSQPITIVTKNAECPDPNPAPAVATDPVCSDPLYMGAAVCAPGSTDPVCKDPGKIVKLNMWHAYWVKNIDASARTVTLANPWGSDRPTVTWPWSRLQKSLRYAFINDKAPEK